MENGTRADRLVSATLKNCRGSVKRCVEETAASALALSYCVKLASERETVESLGALLECLAPGRYPQDDLRKRHVENNVMAGLKSALRSGSCQAAGLMLDSGLFAFWASDSESQRRVACKLDNLFASETVAAEDIGRDRTGILAMVMPRIANDGIKKEIARKCAVWDKPGELEIAASGMGLDSLSELLAQASGGSGAKTLSAAQEWLIVRLHGMAGAEGELMRIAQSCFDGQRQAMFAFMLALEKGSLSDCAGPGASGAKRVSI